jgi:hypothetical protein
VPGAFRGKPIVFELEVGADMDLVDEYGYTALDFAVFAGDAVAEEIVSDGLQRGGLSRRKQQAHGTTG